MEDGFEAAARAEVARLRAKADELEAWLARYAGQGSSALQTSREHAASEHASNGDQVDAGRHSPPSKKGRNAPLLRAIEAAGPAGLTLEQVHDAAFKAGLRPNRATIRSFLWNQRNSGRLVARKDGRHVMAKHGNADGRDSPSDVPAEDQGDRE